MKKIDEVKIMFDKEYFKQLRKEKNIKLNKLAEIAGIDYHNLVALSKGHNQNPSASTIYKIATALDVLMEDLMKEVSYES